MWRNEKIFKGTFEQRSTQWTQFPGRESKSVSFLPGRAGFGALRLMCRECGPESQSSKWMENGRLCSRLGTETMAASIDPLVLFCPSLPPPCFLFPSLPSFWPPSFHLFLSLLETGSHHVRLALKLLYSEEDFELLLPPLSWDHRHASGCLAYSILGIELLTSCVLGKPSPNTATRTTPCILILTCLVHVLIFFSFTTTEHVDTHTAKVQLYLSKEHLPWLRGVLVLLLESYNTHLFSLYISMG